MRTSVFPRAFSLYPGWLRPVLLSLGALFMVTAMFLMILIWKSTPSAAAVQMSAASALPALSVPPQAAVPASAPAQAGAVAPIAHKSAKRHTVAHHKTA